MPKKKNKWFNFSFFNKDDEADDEREEDLGDQGSDYDEEESHTSERQIYDDDLDDTELITRSEQARQKLLTLLADITEYYKDYQPNQYIYTTDKEKKEEKIRWEQASKLLSQAVKDDNKKIKYYDDLILRLTPWIGFKPAKPPATTDRQEADELKQIKEHLTEWKTTKAKEYQDKKEDLTAAIDNIKNAVSSHLGNWEKELDALVPKDTAQIKEKAKQDLIAWEQQLFKDFKQWIASNKKLNLEGHEVDLNNKEVKALQGLVNQAKSGIIV